MTAKNLNQITFCYYKLAKWFEIYKKPNNFIMYNNINEMFLLFEIQPDKTNKLIKTFTFKDILFNF